MKHNKQLEISLRRFENMVSRLVESPTLDTALGANLSSIELRELFHQIESDEGGIPVEAARTYLGYAYTCLNTFQEMIPGLNEEKRHVDLYSEQMRGRMALVNQMKQYGNGKQNETRIEMPSM